MCVRNNISTHFCYIQIQRLMQIYTCADDGITMDIHNIFWFCRKTLPLLLRNRHLPLSYVSFLKMLYIEMLGRRKPNTMCPPCAAHMICVTK